MASATAIPNRAPVEIYIGGAGDEHSRLVLSYAEARSTRMSGKRRVHYVPHWKTTAATRLATELASDGHPLALIGHSWGADTALRTAHAITGKVFVIGVDPVAKPVSWLAARDVRPPSAGLIVHVDADPPAFDRSDYVKAVGFFAGGGVPNAFRMADARIDTALNHWNFRGMMQAKGSDGQTAEDWLAVFPERLSQRAG